MHVPRVSRGDDIGVIVNLGGAPRVLRKPPRTKMDSMDVTMAFEVCVDSGIV